MPRLRKANPVGILTSAQALTPAQRQHYIRLKSRGVEEDVARALAQALAKSSRSGKKPLGAAFSHGRKKAKEQGGGEKKEKASANAYLRANGHEEVAKATERNAGQKDDEREHADPKTKGAAFQYARRLNLQRGGDKKAVRQIAEDYLTARGHKPLKKARTFGPFTSKLTSRQRIEAFNVTPIELDIDDRWDLVESELAADAALAEEPVEGEEEPTEEIEKAAFPRAFLAAAKDKLPPYFYDQVHAHARCSAGGTASAASRRARAGSQAHLDELWEQHNALSNQLEELANAIQQHPAIRPDDYAVDAATGGLAKSVPVAAEIHVDRPLGSDRPRKKKKQKLAKASPFAVDALLAQSALVAPEDGRQAKLENAVRLVTGMDWERRLGATSTADARGRASRQLAQDAAFYDNRFQADMELRSLRGIDVDLGSGQGRAPGHLGLDLFPYDHGTAIYDLGLGVPMCDASVRSVRLVNALHFMLEAEQDATPLLSEIQRVLTYGGKLFYEGRGDLTQKADWSQLPGLVLVDHKDTQALIEGQEPSDSDLHIQTFERVRTRLPRIYGADPEWCGYTEDGPEDLALALRAMGGDAPADRAMESLLGKSSEEDVHVEAPLVAGRSDWQKIIYSVVYAPNEQDIDGEYMEERDIEKMAHDAFRERIPIKFEHQGDPIGAHLVESYIVKSDHTVRGPEGPQHIPKGAWMVGIQFTDDAAWQNVLNGKWRGISVGGRALYEHR